MPSDSPSPASQSADGQPLRVAECSSCRQLFAVYETEGLISCPGCSATTAVASLEIAELGIAAPVTPVVLDPVSEPVIAASPEPQEAPTPAIPEANPGELAEEPKDPSRPPTVAEWLMQSEPAAPTPTPTPAPASDPLPEPAVPKRSLSESLGWNPAGFQLDGLAEPTPGDSLASEQATAPARPAEPEPPTTAPRTEQPVSDFRFDFASSPLAEHPAASSPSPTEPAFAVEEPADAVSLELSTPSAEADEEADFNALLSGATEPQRRGWSAPLSAAAGILLVAAPAAYLALTWPSEGELADASENRGRRLVAESSDPGTDLEAELNVSTLPFGEDLAAESTVPQPEESDDPPIQDPATQPASFEAPSTDLPPNPFPASGPIDTPAYRAAEATPQEAQEAAPVGDRYASMQVESEPEGFTLPEDDFAAIETTTEPAPLAPVERTAQPAIGLVNAPRYSTQQLSEAFDQAVPAGKGFAEGTLTDPTQVSSMGQHYARLCYLAQVLTLLDPAEKQGGVFTAELEAADVFTRLFREERPRVESRQIAGPWIGWTGRPHGGVFFAGVPEEMKAAGKTVQYVFRVGEVTVPVVMAEKINVDRFINSAAREVGVIGLVVENPRDWIAGYEGDAERVVWARKTLPLRAPREL